MEQDKSLREIVVEALQAWVHRQEEMEDLAAIHETEGEESYPWDQVKRELHTRKQDERVA